MSLGSPALPEEIERQIVAFLANELGQATTRSLSRDENLLTGEYIDSIGIMRLIAHVETTFGVSIPPTDLIPENFRTVRVMAAYLAGQGAQV
jgi:acyl carrier protein